MRRPGVRRGMTLIEIIVSLGITMVVAAMASTLVMQGANLTRKGEETANNNDASRFAGEVIASSLQHAGFGMAAGLYTSSTLMTNALSILDNPTYGSTVCPDELWVVVPNRNAMRESCRSPGAAAMVQAAPGGGVLALRCNESLLGSPLLVASNMQRAALITTPVFTSAGTYMNLSGYDNMAAGYSNAPERGGFQPGDLVYPVTVLHYFVANVKTGNPGDMTPPTGLWMRRGKRGTPTAPQNVAYPFIDDTGTNDTKRLIQNDIEDLQFAAGTSIDNFTTNPRGDVVTFSSGSFFWQFSSGAPMPKLRSVRLSVTSRSARVIYNSEGKRMADPGFAPMIVENHSPATTADGHSRNLYQRRVELPNMAPERI